MSGHENASAAVLVGTFTTKTGDLAVLVNLVVLQDGKLDLLSLVLDLLGRGEGLLLTLLAATSEAEDKMKSGLLLDVVVREGPSILELLAGEDQPLLVWGDALLVLDLGLDVLDRVGRLGLQGDS